MVADGSGTITSMGTLGSGDFSEFGLTEQRVSDLYAKESRTD
jgi:hypothetical protein